MGGGCRRAPARVPWVLPRIFVYPLPSRFHSDITKKYRRCVTDQYGTETFIHEALLKSEFVTTNPEEADLFFVPVYGECFLWSWEMLRHAPQEVAFGHTAQLYQDALAIVQQEHGWWNRSGGRDHVWVFPGARGPTIFRAWHECIANSIFLTPEGDRSLPYFNTWKDVVIPGLEAAPEFTRPSSRDQLLQLEGRPRKHLAHFRGTIRHSAGWAYSQGLRPRLQALFANRSDIIFDTKHSDCDRHCYRQEMVESEFCLNPLGWSPWTLRFFQAIMLRCIPVMIADNIEFPYESSIDYSRFVLKIPQHSVDNIVSIMRDMPPAERARRRREMDKVWLMFTWQNPPIPGDAFYSLMQQLAMKTRASRNGPLAFWPRNGPSA